MSCLQLKRPRSEPQALLHFLGDTKVPSEYICPLSWRIMSEPVLDPDDPEGRAVEREAFEAHQRQYGVRPLTGLPAIPPVDIRTLVNLQRAISHFITDEEDTSQQQPPVKRARLTSAPAEVPISAPPPRPAPAVVASRPLLNLRESEIPSPYFCPLSRAVMSDPVVDRRDPGASMERATVEDHVAQYGTNPRTGEPMAASDLIPDKGLRSAVSRWLAKHTGPELRLHTAPLNNTAPPPPPAGHGTGNAAADAPAATTAAVMSLAAAGGAAPRPPAALLQLLSSSSFPAPLTTPSQDQPAPPPAGVAQQRVRQMPAAVKFEAIKAAAGMGSAAGGMRSGGDEEHGPLVMMDRLEVEAAAGYLLAIRESSGSSSRDRPAAAAPAGGEWAGGGGGSSDQTGPLGPLAALEDEHAAAAAAWAVATKTAGQGGGDGGEGSSDVAAAEAARRSGGAAGAVGPAGRLGPGAGQGGSRPLASGPSKQLGGSQHYSRRSGAMLGAAAAEAAEAAAADGQIAAAGALWAAAAPCHAASAGAGISEPGSGAMDDEDDSSGAAADEEEAAGFHPQGAPQLQAGAGRLQRQQLAGGPRRCANVPYMDEVAVQSAGARRGSGGGGSQQQLAAGYGQDVRSQRFFSSKEVEALMDGILRHGFLWRLILLQNRAVFGNRNEMSLKNKWEHLRAWAAQGWARRQGHELPGEEARMKVEAAMAAASVMAAGQQGVTSPALQAQPEPAGEDGEPGDGQQQQQAAAGAGAAGGSSTPEDARSFRYTDEELGALLDGILEHGCNWKAIIQAKGPALRNRNQASLVFKWNNLRTWAAQGWPRSGRRGYELPPEDARRKVEAVMELVDQQAGGAVSQWPLIGRLTPIVVPSDIVLELAGEHVVREGVSVQIREDGFKTHPHVFSAILRNNNRHGRHQLTQCGSLRKALQGKVIRGWDLTPDKHLLVMMRMPTTAGSNGGGDGGGDGGGAGGREDGDGDDDEDDDLGEDAARLPGSGGGAGGGGLVPDVGGGGVGGDDVMGADGRESEVASSGDDDSTEGEEY